MKVTAVLQDPELEWMKIGLRDMGIKAPAIRVFQSDLEALQTAYLEGRPDLMVVDLDLPGVIGLETIRAMRQQKEFEPLPLILVSFRDLAMGSRAAVRTQCLVKPVHPDAWVDAVRLGLSARPPRPAQAPAESQPGESALYDRPEFRKAARRAFETPCLIVAAGKKVKGVLKDISLTGARISLYGELAGSAMVTLLFGIPGTVPLRIVQFKARVVRRTSDGYAITFREMDSDTRGYLLSVTSKQAT